MLYKEAIPSRFSELVLRRRSELWDDGLGAEHPAATCEAEVVAKAMPAQWKCCSRWQRKLSNKLNAKEFARSHAVDVAKVLWVGRDLLELDMNEMPRSFVVKSTNGWASRHVVPVVDRWDVLRRAPLTESYLRHHFDAVLPPVSERRGLLFVEEFIDPAGNGTLPLDYKVYCFGGDPVYIEVVDRMRRADAWYSTRWRRVADRMQLRFGSSPTMDAPARLPELLDASHRLSTSYGYPFVRLDFFMGSGGVYLCEVTHTPFAGDIRGMLTDFADARLGRLWRASLQSQKCAGN